MTLQLRIRTDFTFAQAKAMNKIDDSICVRQAAMPGERTKLRSLCLKLGGDPVRDAATLVSALWGRKRHAKALYLFVCHEDLQVLQDAAYVAKLQAAFERCRRRSPEADFTLFLIPQSPVVLAG